MLTTKLQAAPQVSLLNAVLIKRGFCHIENSAIPFVRRPLVLNKFGIQNSVDSRIQTTYGSHEEYIEIPKIYHR